MKINSPICARVIINWKLIRCCAWGWKWMKNNSLIWDLLLLSSNMFSYKNEKPKTQTEKVASVSICAIWTLNQTLTHVSICLYLSHTHLSLSRTHTSLSYTYTHCSLSLAHTHLSLSHTHSHKSARCLPATPLRHCCFTVSLTAIWDIHQ